MIDVMRAGQGLYGLSEAPGTAPATWVPVMIVST
jgi:alanine racemase